MTIKFKEKFRPAKPENWKNNREVWVRALKSGAFKQGTGALRTLDDEFCCLGVYAYLTGIKPVKHKSERVFKYNSVASHIPLDLLDFAGIRDGLGQYGTGALYKDNDSRKLSFDQIAEIIKSEPSLLFCDPSKP